MWQYLAIVGLIVAMRYAETVPDRWRLKRAIWRQSKQRTEVGTVAYVEAFPRGGVFFIRCHRCGHVEAFADAEELVEAGFDHAGECRPELDSGHEPGCDGTDQGDGYCECGLIFYSDEAVPA